MAVIKTLQAGNPTIRKKSALVADAQADSIKKVIKDLTDTMRHENLVGMAAPQIGHNVRIFVTELRETKYRKGDLDELRVFINPEIVQRSEKLISEYEGCGSVASSHLFGPVKRPAEVRVKAKNEKGDIFELTASGLLCVVIQHEIDHLDGVLFSDKIEDIKKVMSWEEYIKFRSK